MFRSPPKIPKSILDGDAFHEAASNFHERFNHALSKLLDIASGKDPALFILVFLLLTLHAWTLDLNCKILIKIIYLPNYQTVVSLYILSVIGSYFTFLNFLYLSKNLSPSILELTYIFSMILSFWLNWYYVVFLCFQTLPFLYDRFEEQVDDYTGRLFRQVKKRYRRFESRVLNKIPRGAVKEKVR